MFAVETPKHVTNPKMTCFVQLLKARDSSAIGEVITESLILIKNHLQMNSPLMCLTGAVISERIIRLNSITDIWPAYD